MEALSIGVLIRFETSGKSFVWDFLSGFFHRENYKKLVFSVSSFDLCSLSSLADVRDIEH